MEKTEQLENSLAKEYLNYIPLHGKRKKGRPALTFNGHINNVRNNQRIDDPLGIG